MSFREALHTLLPEHDHVYKPFGTPQAVGTVGEGQRSVVSTGDDRADAILEMMAQLHVEMRRANRAAFNDANPVDEWSSSVTAAPASVTVQRQYDLPERIESLLVSLPVGITSANLQLGQNNIPLYNGAATVLQTLVNFTGLGIILSPGDQRVLSFVGAATTGYAVALMGHVLEREGLR